MTPHKLPRISSAFAFGGLLAAFALGSAAAFAQTAPVPTAAPAKSAKPSASRVEAKSKASNMAAGIIAAEAALTPGELAVAERVYTGRLPCELGSFVTVTADPKTPGYFDVLEGKQKFRMFPVETTTGAVRLEDKKAGAVWLQLGNKSMLMSQKLGTRLADECMSPAQTAVAAALKIQPALSPLDTRPATSNSTPTQFTKP